MGRALAAMDSDITPALVKQGTLVTGAAARREVTAEEKVLVIAGGVVHDRGGRASANAAWQRAASTASVRMPRIFAGVSRTWFERHGERGLSSTSTGRRSSLLTG